MLQHDFLPTLPSLLAHSNVPLIHRDLSWLQFNDRVLSESRQLTNPLLERAKFLAISATNLDEFFMIRFASIGKEVLSLEKKDTLGAARLARIRDNILEQVAKFGAKQLESLDILSTEMESEKIRVIRFTGTGQDRGADHDRMMECGQKVFKEQVVSKLQPPEGFSPSKLIQLDNLQMCILCEERNLWFRIPRTTPQVFLHRDGEEVFCFFLDDLLLTFLSNHFNLGAGVGCLRLTRDGDFSLELAKENLASLPEAVRSGIKSRDRGRAVRLQYGGDLTEKFLRSAANALRLLNSQLFLWPSTLCLGGLWTLFHHSQRPADGTRSLLYPEFKASVPLSNKRGSALFDEIKKGDVFFHHPYDSFEGVVKWLETAADDPKVESIEQTIYRMDPGSPVITALKKVAKKKRVRVFIELRARFDELNNVELADELKTAGAEVVFGFGKLKLHAKVALVARREGEGLVFYTHLSTGNYNSQTAKHYTDFAILTANQEIGQDAKNFLDAVASGVVPTQFKHLATAPAKLHRKLITLIEAEAEAAKKGRLARIVVKVNALVDGEVIEKLYKASQAGVEVIIICRGPCSAIPEVKHLSDRLKVVSIVDRYLEHSRLYWFMDSKAMYLSSADWMPRNFFSRLEIAFPVLDPRIYTYLERVVIPGYLADSSRARELTPQGTWKKRTGSSVKRWIKELGSLRVNASIKNLRSQFFFQDLALTQYAGTPLSEAHVRTSEAHVRTSEAHVRTSEAHQKDKT